MNARTTIPKLARAVPRSRTNVVLLAPSRLAHRPYGYTYSTSNPPSAATPNAQSPAASKISAEPIPLVETPVYPPPKNPFDAVPSSSQAATAPRSHSKLKIAVVKALASVMGYNSKSSTAIRETGRICGTIVTGVEKSRSFWYDECALPPTYQTFFQLHLLYLLIALPRIRAIAASPALSATTEPLSQKYQTELLNHFFALAETQMRVTLGEGERERVIRKYMQEMGEQWKGASVGFDYAVARGQAAVVEGREAELGEAETEGGDAEMASWVWRNLFGARGAPIGAPARSSAAKSPDVTDLKLAVNLAKAVAFIRREMYRFDQLTDEQVMSGEVGEFGGVEDVQET